ncbi:MAG TPA: hypothetical protein VMH81_05840 [Bryobacteraceae bacterium]|nr:hypothetical protein [Bryobacteraceae bacterium]
MLRYVAERTLSGDAGTLKERTLGIDVFGRMPDYDTNADPVARGTAGEVRKKLALYYQDPEHTGEIRIELNRGGYIPEFHAPPVAVPPAEGPRRRLLSRHTWVMLLGALAVTFAGTFLIREWRKPALDRFWEPMLDSPASALFGVAQPRTYNFRSDARQRDMETMLQGLSPSEIASSREMVPLRDLVPLWDRYFAVGDAMCLLRLASVFEKHGKPYNIRGASTSFSDLREHPTVLIGAFDNEWTLRATGQLRYTFYKDFQGLEIVRDRDHPEKNDWKLVNSWPYWDIPVDYAIVSRVLDRTTDRMVVIAAGITQFGTAAAGEFLSDPTEFSEAIPQLPHDWYRRNIQIVLSVPVVHGAGGHPRVLATHVW